MKTKITLLLLMFSLCTLAQTNIPQLVSFSAVVRDANNIPLVNTNVSIRLTFKQGGQNGQMVYCALHQTTTNQNGFMSLLLNREVLGTSCNGAPNTNFENIPWENGNFWMEVEYQTVPNTPFESLGQLELASSFYAFAAGTAERLTNFNLSNPSNGDVIVYNAALGQWVPGQAQGSSFQNLSVSNSSDTLYISNGNWVIIPGISAANGGIGSYPAGYVHCNGIPTAVVDVTNPITGRTWMDRNLGASQVATSSSDEFAYGDLYQWGRRADGHQCRTSPTSTTLSSSNQPGHGNFILASNSPSDWRSPQNTNLWQGVNGVNNPCPSGYRLPTEPELNAERQSWSSNNAAGAFASPLKLSMAGVRNGMNGLLYNVGDHGFYWSNTVITSSSRYLLFIGSNAQIGSNSRSSGFSVRCIKN